MGENCDVIQTVLQKKKRKKICWFWINVSSRPTQRRLRNAFTTCVFARLYQCVHYVSVYSTGQQTAAAGSITQLLYFQGDDHGTLTAASHRDRHKARWGEPDVLHTPVSESAAAQTDRRTFDILCKLSAQDFKQRPVGASMAETAGESYVICPLQH